MKALIRDYLASLKEREELDAVLPDLLSELGFNVISRPQRGTTQRGVDVAAVGRDIDGEEKLFLFSVKPGDLGRTDWNGPHDQALRPSLDEILDGYLPSRVPPRLRSHKVVICICVGGEIREEVKDLVAGYTAAKTTDRVSFDQWNGDRIAAHLLSGILREEVLPRAIRSRFQKAVAMVDEPDVAYHHFKVLAEQLVRDGARSMRARLRSARQLSLCAWIIFVWARDVGNVEAAYRISELALLYAWELRRPTLGSKARDAEALHLVIQQLIELHLKVGGELIETKVLPHASVQDAVSVAVRSRNALDVNLALFELLGRIGMLGLWVHWISSIAQEAQSAQAAEAVDRLVDAGLDLIENNHALLLPVTDHQSTDVAIFLQCWLASSRSGDRVASWLSHMANRLAFTWRSNGRYPATSGDYRDLVEHPREPSEAYFREATDASTLTPLLAVWLATFGLAEDLKTVAAVVAAQLEHCTQQWWTPDGDSEAHLYLNSDEHGMAICDLPIDADGRALHETLQAATEREKAVHDLSAVKANLWPIVLTACRHYRLPVPPAFWIEAVRILPNPHSPEAQDRSHPR